MLTTLRFHCFRNGDWERKDGFILLFDCNSSPQQDHNNLTSLDQLKIKSSKVLFPFFFESDQSSVMSLDEHLSKIRVFSKYGSEIKRMEELRDDDVLFFSCFNEDFLNFAMKMNYQVKQSSEMHRVLSIQQVATSTDSQTVDSNDILNKYEEYSITINSLSTKKEITIDKLNGKVTIDQLKKLILNNSANKENLLGRGDFPLKFTEDFILVHKGKELKDNEDVEKLFFSHPTLSKLTVFMVMKKPVYYVKLMMEGGRLVIIDNDSISFSSHISDLKSYLEKRMKMNLTYTNKELVLMWNQDRLTGSECLGNAFPSKSSLSLTFI